VHVTGGNVAIQNMFQADLWLMLDELLLRFGKPDPQWNQHSKMVLRWTLFRKDRFVKGGASYFDDDDCFFESDPLAIKLLQVLNGNWIEARAAHYCEGCCNCEADAKVLVFGMLCEVDIMNAGHLSG
jgi:hypothetical protein